MSKYSDIIEREFKARGFKDVKCDDSTPEVFKVKVEKGSYTCNVGSDDDQFIFHRDDLGYPRIILFDIPKDWGPHDQ